MSMVSQFGITRDYLFPARPARTLLLNRFKLLGKIGSGGMAKVHRAVERTNQTSVAIKFALYADLNGHVENEAATVFALPENPHLPRFIDHGEHEGAYWLAMPFIEGDLLRTRLDNGQLSLSESLKIVSQVANGLADAARNGIIHRDLKPENIIIGSDGIVHILDFGLTHVDEAGALVGSLEYISPEQLTNNQGIDHRSDIYSLGLIFYEMVTGRKAHIIDETMPLMEQVCAAMRNAEANLPALGLVSLDDKAQSLTTEFLWRLSAHEAQERYQTFEEVMAAANQIKERLAAFNAEMEKELALLNPGPLASTL
jgi:serine/threonine protein kinase